MTLRRLVLFAWPVFAACGNAGFSPGTPRTRGEAPHLQPTSAEQTSANASPEAAQPIRGKGATADTGGKIDTDDENETADPPQPVSGAFLTCASLSGPDVGPDERGFGCRVEKGGQMLDMTGETMTADVVDAKTGTSQRSSSRVVMLPPGSPWHMAVTVPAAQVAGKMLAVSVDWKADQSPVPEVLRVALDKPAPSDGSSTLHFGGSGAFHLGNDTFNESKCKDGIQGVPLTGKRVGLPLTIGGSGAQVTIRLTGICGVDYFSNDVDLFDAADQVVTGFTFDPGVKDDELETVNLPPGNYMLELAANRTRSGDRDDFVVGDVFVTTKGGPVTAGKPTVLP